MREDGGRKTVERVFLGLSSSVLRLSRGRTLSMSSLTDCRISTETIAGWRAIVLENDLIRAVLLPDKGADLYRLIHKPSGTDILYQSHWGLQPPGSPPREGSGEIEFQWNYEGAWQELF